MGGRRGVLSDWITQRWVQATGKAVTVAEHPWLEGPVGDVDLIGSAFFRWLAERRKLDVVANGPGRGLLDDFSRLRGPTCNPDDIDARVVAFYENTADFEFDVWSEWCGVFRPFGGALAAIFSRVPGFPGPCVKVVFPLPNGSAIVIMRPESEPGGSLVVRSTGARFGDPGFYFFVEQEPGRGWARYVRALQESIRVYADGAGALRADHDLRIWGMRFLRLHYRMRRRASG